MVDPVVSSVFEDLCFTNVTSECITNVRTSTTIGGEDQVRRKRAGYLHSYLRLRK